MIPFLFKQAGFGGDVTPAQIPNLSGWWKQGDWTSAAERVSQWNDISGNARHLLQATGANQPIELPWTGENYAWSPGVLNNRFSAPDSVANSITGDISFIALIAPDSVTPSAAQATFSKWLATGNQRSYSFGLSITSGRPYISWTVDGTASVVTMTADATPTWSNFGFIWLLGTLDVDDGAGNRVAKFYTAAATSATSLPTVWTQLGSTVTTAGTTSIFDSTAAVSVGGDQSSNSFTGKVKRALLYSGVVASNGTGGTLKADFNPTLQTEGATSWTSATGEVWTTNVSGAKQAQIVGSPQLVGDGAAYFMRASYTQAQPVTRFFLARRNLWSITTASRYTTDGVGANSAAILDKTSTPTTAIHAGASVADNTGMTLSAYHIVAVVFDGASSKYYIDAAATTGDAGAATTGGLTIMADGGVPTASTFSGTQLKEIIEFNAALTAAQITAMARYLNRIGSLGISI